MINHKKIYNQTFDTLVVGGGIVGIGIFRDLSLHGVKTLLIDSKDFCGETSQSSSKMLHGGIRYLENLDFLLVEEALRERNIWEKLTPHLTKREQFYLPIYKDSKHPLCMAKLGTWLYRTLANEKGPKKNDSHPLNHFPQLNKKNLKGFAVYEDVIMDDFTLGLECLMDALQEKNSFAENYTSFQTFHHGKEMITVELKNEITHHEFKVHCKNIIFSLGPFTDRVLSKQYPSSWQNQLLPSRGSHLWIKKERLPLTAPMVMLNNDGRVIFAIPHVQGILLGTTEVSVTDYEQKQSSPKETNYLLEATNHLFPEAKITHEDLLGSFSGIRPLVNQSRGTHETSREHKVLSLHPNVHAIFGGKYTTFRSMGQEITRQIVQKNHQSYDRNLSLRPLRKKCLFNSFAPISMQVLENEKLFGELTDLIIQNEFVKTSSDIRRRLHLMNHQNLPESFSFPENL